jgi:hypothetical protein
MMSAPIHVLANLSSAVIVSGLIVIAFASTTAFAGGSNATKYRKVPVKLPQGYVDTLGASQYGTGNLVDGASYGFGCNPGEVVQTCDANTSITMPDALALYLGPAVNTVLFGAKRKSDCTAMAGTDRSGISGCIYEGCLGYKKPVMMLCKSAGTGQ